MYFHYSLLSAFGEGRGPSFEQTWLPFNQACIVPSLSKLVQWFWRRRFFKISSMYFQYFVIIFPWKKTGPFVWTNLNPLHPRMLCAKFGWNWPSGSVGNFLYFVDVFHYFIIIPPWKRIGPFIWKILTPLNPRMHCAKFGWNLPSCSWEENF